MPQRAEDPPAKKSWRAEIGDVTSVAVFNPRFVKFVTHHWIPHGFLSIFLLTVHVSPTVPATSLESLLVVFSVSPALTVTRAGCCLISHTLPPDKERPLGAGSSAEARVAA